MSELQKLPRPEKLRVARALSSLLQARIDAGAPPDPSLNGFHTEINAISSKLETHVDGLAGVKGKRSALIAAGNESDDLTDYWYRLWHGFLYAAAARRTGPHTPRAQELFKAVFPHGLEHIDDRIVEENAHCRESIEVLRAPENASLLAALNTPSGWLDAFEAAVNQSDADADALEKARGDKNAHIDLAQDADEEWEDIMLRYRHHIAGRAKRAEVQKKNEGRLLLAPLLDAVKKMRADAATRAALKAKDTEPPPKPA